MSESLHDNLTLLYAGFGKEAIDSILPGDIFEVDGVEFVCKYNQGSTANRFYIVKSLDLVDQYRRLCERFIGATIVELGIAEGGSTALIALLARPEKLVAFDIESQPLAALAEFIDARDLSGVVRPHYGVDQADVRLGEIVDADVGDRGIDLVIDDCSHQFDATRTSFEMLFPRLRPGGLYVIEDWNADHVMYDAVRATLADPSDPYHDQVAQQFRESLSNPAQREAAAPRDPLTRLAVELVISRCSLTDAIAEVSVNEYWIVVRRGTGELDPATFRLSDHYSDHFGFVPPRQSAASA